MTASSYPAGSAARTLRDALEPVAAHAFWSAGTRQAMADLGLTATPAYVRGRAATLGSPGAPVVISAFAWFEPGLIESAYHAGPAELAPEDINRARSAATGASLRAVRPDTDPSWLADTLTAAAAAAGASPGRCLFSARRAQVPPPDPFERLWWASETLRDYRGDSHIAAVTVAGAGRAEMNILTELALGGPLGRYTATRGWSPAAIEDAAQTLRGRGWLSGDSLTAAGTDVRMSIERDTDQLDAPVIAAIGGDLPRVLAELETWGRACIDAAAFPPDQFKRAAG
jgi:hypothetical protein